MSRELDAMQFVLDLLTDGIITSAVQQIGFTPHDKITEPELPFVQVYSPIDENQEQTKRQPPGVLTIQLDILDVFGNSNVLRDAIAALDATFRIDNTFHGTVENAFITLRSVAERRNDERSVVGAVITVQIAEGFLDPGVTHVLDFSDASLFTLSAESVKVDSTAVFGAVGIQKVSSGALTSLTASSPGFPKDLSGVHRLRWLTYKNPENIAGILQLRLFSGGDFSLYGASGLSGAGWQSPAFDLDTPALIGGSGADLGDITAITMEYNWAPFSSGFVSTTFGLIACDLFYTSRDTGLNNGRGYDPGL
jgi:hypothetical protein